MVDQLTYRPAEFIGEADKRGLRRVLVIRRGGIGDIILATPALRLLASRLPAAQIDLLVQRGAADAASGLPYIRDIHEVDSRSNPFSLYRLRKLAHRLRDIRYDLVVNLQPGAKTTYLASACRSKYSLTFQKDRSIQCETGLVRHAIDDFAHTLLPLALGPVCDRSLDFVVPEASRAWLRGMLSEQGNSASGQRQSLIVLNPTARRIVNRWPAERWARLLDELCGIEDYRVVVIGAGRDLPDVRHVKSLCRRWGQIIDFSGRITLKDLGALLEQATVLVTGDTGPMHVAAAVNTPIVCLSGAADPCRTGPQTRNSIVLIDRSLPCVPCQNKQCRYSRLPRCMDGISVQQVLSATRRLAGSSHICSLPVVHA